MAVKSVLTRVVVPTVSAAVITSGAAVAITYATAWRTNIWAWLAVGVLTVLSAGVSVWLYYQQDQPPGVAPGPGGGNDLEVGAKAQLGQIEQYSKGRSLRAPWNRIGVGAGAHVKSVRMVAIEGEADGSEPAEPGGA